MEIADSKGNGPRSAPARRWSLSSRAEEAKLIGGMTFERVFHERVGLARGASRWPMLPTLAAQGADASALLSYAAPLFGVVDMRADS